MRSFFFFRRKVPVGVLGVTAGVLLLSSCGGSVRPDLDRFSRLKQDVLLAQEEGLADAAPVEMQFIQQKLAAAELAVEHGDGGKADALMREIAVELETARLRATVNRLNRELDQAKKRNARIQRQLSELQETLHEE